MMTFMEKQNLIGLILIILGTGLGTMDCLLVPHIMVVGLQSIVLVGLLAMAMLVFGWCFWLDEIEIND